MPLRPPSLRLLAVAALAATAPAFAVNNSATLALAFDPPHGAPAVSIVQPADYLCAIVSIRSTAKDTERQAIAVQEALRRITTAVQRSNTFQLHQGPARFFGGGNNASSLFSKSAYNPQSLQTSLRILCPLTPDADFFETIRQVTQFVSSISVPGEAEVKIVSATLAVASAEQQRDRLMQLIREQIVATRTQLGANVLTVTGLDSPVLVRQLDNLSVELFLDYQLSATLEKLSDGQLR
jgi:hypothetical protein